VHQLCVNLAEPAADAAGSVIPDMIMLYGAGHGQGGAGAGGTEARRVDRGKAVGFAPGLAKGDQQRIWAYHDGVDLGGPAMARIARDYGYALAELRKL
jgi:hypothetical protein